MRIRHTILTSLLLCCTTAAAQTHQFTFSWPFSEDQAMQPRGGTTRGPKVTLATEPARSFLSIQEPGLSKQERDRGAILAMAGDHRVSFDFLEVMGFEPGFSPDAPYQSWSTERIYVLEDRPGFISLQHVLVTSVVDENGKTQGPFVVKHWRQDWTLNAGSTYRYRGNNTWARVEVPDETRRGYWVQTVWQVDDSPRYAGWGRWRHEKGYSTWISNTARRPLPRREFSVRDDYDTLIGTNRHTVLPTGWVQEEENLKVILGADNTRQRALAKEYGIARYERIKDYDFAAGDHYFRATSDFWAAVRAYWQTLFSKGEPVQLRAPVDQGVLYVPLFARAEAIARGKTFTARQNRAFIEQTIDGYLAGQPAKNTRTGY